MVLSNIFWNNFMLSRKKCLLNNKSLTNPLLTFICHFFEWRSSIPILGTWVSFWYLWFFFDGPSSELLGSIFIRLRGDLLRGCLLPFWFFIGNCTSFSGHSIESSYSKEDSCTWEYVFSCICFNLLISVFVAITRLGIRSFTGGSPEKLKYIDPNVEMTL